MDNETLLPVSIHFYRLDCFPGGSWHSRLRGWVSSFLTEYVHCNYQIGPWVYNLSTNGFQLVKDRYVVEPSMTVTIRVDAKNVDLFIRRFVQEHLRKQPRWLWARFGLASLPLFCRWLENCASFPKELTDGGERTPSRLFSRLAKTER